MLQLTRMKIIYRARRQRAIIYPVCVCYRLPIRLGLSRTMLSAAQNHHALKKGYYFCVFGRFLLDLTLLLRRIVYLTHHNFWEENAKGAHWGAWLGRVSIAPAITHDQQEPNTNRGAGDMDSEGTWPSTPTPEQSR